MRWLSYIDKLSGWTGLAGVCLLPFLAITILYEVIVRYVFRAPTFWSFETSWMLYSANFLLALGYTLREGAHVRVDVLLNRFGSRTKLIAEMFFLVLFLLVCSVAIWYGAKFALAAWKLKECSHLTLWAPPVYPIKTLIPLAFLVLGLQSVAEFVRKLQILKGQKPL